jgi:ferredoxin
MKMGHLAGKNLYPDLRKRVDQNAVGAPDTKEMYEILKLVFSEDDARIAAQMPMMFSSLGTISKRTGIDQAELKPKLASMADRGLVFDFEIRGKMLYMLAPPVVGFFEFSMMRERKDIDQKRMSELLHHVLIDDPTFMQSFSRSEASPFRVRVHETALDEGTFSEILDYERAVQMVEDAGKWSVALCHCRHVAHHLGRDCRKFPMESCLSLGMGADYTIRHGMAREISRQNAMELLVESREKGLVHTGDNVQHRPTFLCLCCGCCCEVINSFKKFVDYDPPFSSNFEARIDPLLCNGCGKCARACPAEVIDLVEKEHPVKGRVFKKLCKVETEVCLGCGVCHATCKFGAISLKRRSRQKITPESAIKRVLTHAIDQGKLANLILDQGNGIGTAVANRMLTAILALPPAKQALASRQVKSRFVDMMAAKVKV